MFHFSATQVAACLFLSVCSFEHRDFWKNDIAAAFFIVFEHCKTSPIYFQLQKTDITTDGTFLNRLTHSKRIKMDKYHRDKHTYLILLVIKCEKK